jgi:hypothetical protein
MYIYIWVYTHMYIYIDIHKYINIYTYIYTVSPFQMEESWPCQVPHLHCSLAALKRGRFLGWEISRNCRIGSSRNFGYLVGGCCIYLYNIYISIYLYVYNYLYIYLYIYNYLYIIYIYMYILNEWLLVLQLFPWERLATDFSAGMWWRQYYKLFVNCKSGAF